MSPVRHASCSISCSGKRKANGGEKFLVVKRFGEEGGRPCGQRGETNERVISSGEDDDAGRRRNLAKPRLNLHAAHLRHANIEDGNRRAMRTRVPQELLGIVKRFYIQIS